MEVATDSTGFLYRVVILCWRLIRDHEGLLVRLLGDGPDAGMELRITARDQRRPICGEPGRGT